ncbi:hypothetical protein EPD60_07780 [Flaviaesturariibacter flavus]|uniref:Uncharacterized protein n=1 Tax=Flaviaesturariibacter flavus TaxID=2502780 RepID=A0A4R1BF26_9BACT|nr:hypothetical protein [Flaviaesturariibacter flavus]TCJ15751.1 hypothetical protein EPD60_07780 [Flaviaesturariibacter flavus]
MSNSYSSLSTNELEEVYAVTMANYGSIAGELLEEINRRGGEAAFKAQVEKEKELKAEKARIATEVALLMKGQSDPQFPKTMITSTLLSEKELSDFIDLLAKRHVVQQNNAKVHTKTISDSVIGVVIGAILGAIITGLQIFFIGKFYYVSLVVVYLASWLTLRMITKKDAGNVVVLLSAIVSTIVGPLLAFALLIK